MKIKDYGMFYMISLGYEPEDITNHHTHDYGEPRIIKTRWFNNDYYKTQHLIGNKFKTEKEAQTKLREIKKLLLK